MLSGLIFLFLSLWFLPFLVISPAKFAGCFIFSQISFCYGIGLMKGWKNFFLYLFDQKRRWISIIYVITLFVSFYFSILNSQYLVVLPLSIFQVSSLGWIIATAIPGGKMIFKVLRKGVTVCCKNCIKCCWKCATKALQWKKINEKSKIVWMWCIIA